MPADRIRRSPAADLGAGPVGRRTRRPTCGRAREGHGRRAAAPTCAHPDAPLAEQVRGAVRRPRASAARSRADASTTHRPRHVPAARSGAARRSRCVVEPDRAARRPASCSARPPTLGGDRRPRRRDHASRTARRRRCSARWGADRDRARSTARTSKKTSRRRSSTGRRPRTPWAILAGRTAWGREVASRVAARLGAGLTGDAVDLEVGDGPPDRVEARVRRPARRRDRRDVAGPDGDRARRDAPRARAADDQRATAGEHERRRTRADRGARARPHPRRRPRRARRGRRRSSASATASRPTSTTALEPLRTLLGAELGATRKVTDEGWLPRARQVGITGRTIAPRLFVEHRRERQVQPHGRRARRRARCSRSTPTPTRPIFDAADIGIVADWREALPLLVSELSARL